MRKYKTSTFYILENGERYCISTDMTSGESKLINEKKEVIKVVKYDKINRLFQIMEDAEKRDTYKKSV